MKNALRRRLSDAGLLTLADRIHCAFCRVGSSHSNRRFARLEPGYATPPPALAFDAYGHVSWDEYKRTGEAHARFIAGLMRESLPDRPDRVLEWGCGPGRILRALVEVPWLRGVSFTGADVSTDAIAWCCRSVPHVAFRTCDLLPPLPFKSAFFDVVYHYSVFTHLSERSVRAWVPELARVLRPGGIMIGTTHGDGYRRMLSRAELEDYQAGRSTSSAGAVEGRKHFLSFHPPATVRDWLLPVFREVRHLQSPSPEVPQDVWVATR